MKPELGICDPDRIEKYLEDSLTPAETTEFELHLEQCGSCRDRLTNAAAEPSWWSDAGELLRVRPFDIESEATLDEHEVGRSLANDAIDAVLAMLEPSDDPRMLGRLGGYEIRGVVGAGGMGVVMKAFDAPLNRYVAVKALLPHLATSAAARRRFAREAQAAAAVVHDNVIAIHAVADSGKLPFLVMPYLRGRSLERRIQDRGPLPVVEVLRIGMQVAAGLAAAHSQGLVHRDVKPANIMLDDGTDRVTITDFGLARAIDDATVTQSGVIVGTPQFMSPEQARGEPVDARSDLFSLGSVLYFAATGRPPFRAESTMGVLRRISDQHARPIREINPEVPEWLEGMIEKLHRKNPEERFPSAERLADLFERCLAHVQQPTTVALPEELRELVRPAKPVSSGSAPPRRRSGIVWQCAAGLAIAVGVGWPLLKKNNEPQIALQPVQSGSTHAEEQFTLQSTTTLSFLRTSIDEIGILSEIRQIDAKLSELEREILQHEGEKK